MTKTTNNFNDAQEEKLLEGLYPDVTQDIWKEDIDFISDCLYAFPYSKKALKSIISKVIIANMNTHPGEEGNYKRMENRIKVNFYKELLARVEDKERKTKKDK